MKQIENFFIITSIKRKKRIGFVTEQRLLLWCGKKELEIDSVSKTKKKDLLPCP